MKYIFAFVLSLILSLCVFAGEFEEYLGTDPDANIIAPGAVKADMFIAGNSDMPSMYMTESALLLQKYCDLAVWNFSCEKFSDVSVLKSMKNLKIPYMIQGNGSSFLPYLKSKDALDFTWGDLNPARKLSDASSKEFCVSSSYAKKMWEAYGKAIHNNGGCGYIFPSYSTPYDFGWCSGGFNPEMIAAFRMDLTGRDEGFTANIDGKEKLFHFKDYAEYYLGFVPQCSSFGLNTWDDYFPVRKAVYDPEGYKDYEYFPSDKASYYAQIDEKTKKEYIPDFLLRDMLIHYESIKFTQSVSDVCDRNGGLYIANPEGENAGNGCDILFMSALKHGAVAVSGENSALTYTRNSQNLLNASNILAKRNAMVLDFSKCHPYTAFIKAYENRFVNSANICLTDSWPKLSAGMAPDTALKDLMASDENVKNNVKSILAAGMGFKYAVLDNSKKKTSGFTAIVSRGIFRPWGEIRSDFSSLWDDPNKNILPEKGLAENGFVFDTVGFESTENVKGEMAVWAVNTAPAGKLQAFLDLLKKEKLKTGIIVCECLDYVLDNNCRIAKLSDYFPSLATETVMDASAGVLPVKCRGEEYNISGNVYSVPGAKPALMSDDGVVLVYKQKLGKSDLYFLAFNPALPENAPVAKYVFGVILNRSSVFQQWESTEESKALVFRDTKGLTVSVKSADFDESVYAKDKITQVRVRCDKSNKEYFVYNCFDGEETKVMSDDFGFVDLGSDKSASVFFIREKQDPGLAVSLNQLRADMEELMKL